MDREQLMAKRAELMAQLAANTVELERAEGHLEQSQSIYRSTTDGLALSWRAIERASIHPNTPAKELKHLLRLHTRAETAAAKEYSERTKRWGHRSGDGHLFACPLGDLPPLNRLMVTADVLGTYRVPPEKHETPSFFTVALSRPVPTGDVNADGEMQMMRLRTRLRVPAELRHDNDLTLRDVLTSRLNDSKGVDQLTRFFGADLLDSVQATLGTASTAETANSGTPGQ